MDTEIIIIIGLTLVGLGCGIAIFVVNRVLPEEDKMLKQTEEISQFLGTDLPAWTLNFDLLNAAVIRPVQTVLLCRCFHPFSTDNA